MCTLLSGLVVHSMVLGGMGSAGSQAAGVGSEYQTLLRKRLSSTELGDCRIGIVALRCLVSRLAGEELQVSPLASALFIAAYKSLVQHDDTCLLPVLPFPGLCCDASA